MKGGGRLGGGYVGRLDPNRWFVLPAHKRGPTTHGEQPVTLVPPSVD